MFSLANGTLAGRTPIQVQGLYAITYDKDIVSSAWSNDGKRLIWADEHGSVYLVNVAGETSTLTTGLLRGIESDQIKFVWSPSDRFVVVMVGDRGWIAALPHSV
jgi:hypothetical protein